MTNNYPEYVNKIIPADIQDEMTDSREESITDFGIAVMGGVKSNMENPFGTASGQLVTSISEDSEARDIREGTLRIINFTQTNPTGGVFGTPYYPTVGYVGIIKEVVISTNSTTAKKIRFRVTQGIPGEQASKDFLYNIIDSAPLIFKHPVVIGAGGNIQYVSDEAFTGTLLFTAVIIEKPLVV